jgi:hypothetical protein
VAGGGVWKLNRNTSHNNITEHPCCLHLPVMPLIPSIW